LVFWKVYTMMHGQKNIETGRPVSSGLQEPGEPGRCRTRTRQGQESTSLCHGHDIVK